MWWNIFILVASFLVSAAFAKKPSIPKPAALEDFDFPQFDEGTPQAVIFGDVWTEDWMVIGVGNYRTKAIKKETGGFLGIGSSDVTVGYRYFFGLHMGIGRGPLDELVEIRVGDRTAWRSGMPTTKPNVFETLKSAFARRTPPASWREFDPLAPTTITETGPNYIYAPNLFGGDDSEGGIVGTLDVMMGEPTQTTPSRLAAMLGGLVPAFRGRTTLFFDGQISAMSPYPKLWKFRWRRALKGWDGAVWYPEKAVIELAGGTIKAMNPAHILYEACTNRDWGRKLSSGALNIDAFAAFADMCHAENLGLCLRWTRQDSLDNFIQSVLDHVGATMYTDRPSGLITIKLIRNDYDPDAIPLFDRDSGLLSIEDDESAAQNVGPNEYVVEFRRPQDGSKGSVRIQNLASTQSVGGKIPGLRDYPGFPTAELALRAAQRDLRTSSGVLKRFKLRFDRRASGNQPGSVFRIADPARDIANIVLRAGRIEGRDPTDGAITITTVQDVFGLPATSYVAEQPNEWEPPDPTAHPIEDRAVIEAPYFALARGLSAADFSALDANSGYLSTFARASNSARNFLIATRIGSSGDFTERGSDDFGPTGTLSAVLEIDETIATISGGYALDDVSVGTVALINDEVARVVSIDLDTNEVTLARGCADTQPEEHASGSRIWFFETGAGADQTEYAAGNEVEVKLLPTTSSDILPPSAADIDSLTMDQRQFRPYPPANVEINGEAYPTETVGSLEVTWAGRNRVTQADQLIAFNEGHIVPEAGTGYSLRIKRADTDAVVFSRSGIPTVSAGGIYRVSGYSVEAERDYILELWTVRSGVASRDTIVRPFSVFGYGRTYGRHYGGAINPGTVAVKGQPPPVIEPIPGLDTEVVVTVEFTGSMPSTDLLRFSVYFAPLGGISISQDYVIDAADFSSLAELAGALVSHVLEDFPAEVAANQSGNSAILSTFFGTLSVSASNDTASTYFVVEQASAPITIGAQAMVTGDFYELAPNSFPPPAVIEGVGPSVSEKYAGGGTIIARFLIGGLTFETRKAFGISGAREFVVLFNLPDFGAGAVCSYGVPLNGMQGIGGGLKDALTAFQTEPGLSAFIQSVQMTQVSAPFVTFGAPRAGIVVTMKPNYSISRQFYETTSTNTPGGMSPLKFLLKENRNGLPFYPEGAKKVVTVTFTSSYDAGVLVESIQLGQTYFVELDGVRYATDTIAQDVTDAMGAYYRDAIYNRLKVLIEADGYVVSFNTFNRQDGTGTWISSMQIEGPAVNVDYSVRIGASFGVDVSIIRS